MESIKTTIMKEAYELGKLLTVIEGVSDVKVKNGGDGYYYVIFLINYNDIEIRTEIITLVKEYDLEGINFGHKWRIALDRYDINK